MKMFVCDICGSEIKGDYKEVFTSTTDLLKSDFSKNDVCMKCWNAFKQTKRIPVVEFPNSEAKNE